MNYNILVSNRPLPSSRTPLFQNEGRCSAFDMEIIFQSHTNKTHFHNKGCAPSLVLKVRVFGTRKWPIRRGHWIEALKTHLYGVSLDLRQIHSQIPVRRRPVSIVFTPSHLLTGICEYFTLGRGWPCLNESSVLLFNGLVEFETGLNWTIVTSVLLDTKHPPKLSVCGWGGGGGRGET